MKKVLTVSFLFIFSLSINAQSKNLSSSEIYLGLNKLSTVANVMYLAAHPDDENTLMITWLSKDKNARVAYYSMTRGDGGQNLIGSEQGEYVGLIRTHELLEARKVDGGEQYFSRALDFGFSKSTDETLALWGKEEILGDLVYRIRKFKPDVIINRFPPDERAGHGHHSASALLSIEAFDAAADPKRFPDQLQEVEVWQPTRLVWNTFSRGFTNNSPDEGKYIEVPLGNFNSILGEGYTEIAGRARSSHRSQGFGSAPTRTERFDYLLNIKGKAADADIFDGINTSWERVEGGEPISTLLQDIIKNYDFLNPSKSVNSLLKVYEKINALPNNVYKESKLEECRKLIFSCTGIYLEVNSATNSISPGESLKLLATAVNRSKIPVQFSQLKIYGASQKDTLLNLLLENNRQKSISFNVGIPQNASISQPYWMQLQNEPGRYRLSDEKYRNLPMAPDPLWAEFDININGTPIKYKQAIKYKYTEPSRGEIYKYLEIRPEVMLNFEQNVFIFNNTEPKTVVVYVKNNLPTNKVSVSLNLPHGWSYSPKNIEVEFSEKDQEKPVYFKVVAGKINPEIIIKAVATTVNGSFSNGYKHISYEHIPELNVFPKSEAKAIYLDIKIAGTKIGYIMGAGDEVAQSLQQIGYDITYLDNNSLKGDFLNSLDAVIVGVRAYNTEDWLANSQSVLLDYVKNGGNLIVQYQTQAFYGVVKTNELGPYPFTIGRGRVTDENAKVNFTNPNAPILNYPNRITSKDFDGWVQERGLYFAQEWSGSYKTVLSMKDKGENWEEGSLLYGTYGKGNYVFTGLSLFRQLPAGVSGAYRLMANMISLSKNK